MNRKYSKSACSLGPYSKSISGDTTCKSVSVRQEETDQIRYMYVLTTNVTCDTALLDWCTYLRGLSAPVGTSEQRAIFCTLVNVNVLQIDIYGNNTPVKRQRKHVLQYCSLILCYQMPLTLKMRSRPPKDGTVQGLYPKVYQIYII